MAEIIDWSKIGIINQLAMNVAVWCDFSFGDCEFEICIGSPAKEECRDFKHYSLNSFNELTDDVIAFLKSLGG